MTTINRSYVTIDKTIQAGIRDGTSTVAALTRLCSDQNIVTDAHRLPLAGGAIESVQQVVERRLDALRRASKVVQDEKTKEWYLLRLNGTRVIPPEPREPARRGRPATA